MRRRRATVAGSLALAASLLGASALLQRELALDLVGVGTTGGAETVATDRVAAEAPAPRLVLAFGGDVHFEGRIRGVLADDPAAVMAGVRPVLESADLAVVNLETALTARGRAPAGKQYAFRAPASALDALKAAGVDVATVANNHGVDFGRDGLEDTIAAGEAAGFPLVGIGRDAVAALQPHVTEVRGQRVAVIGATQVLDNDLRQAWTATDEQPGLATTGDLERLTHVVHEARQANDLVVVYVHWGVEGQTCPSGAQQDLARHLVDAGADLVVGSHAHRLQGAGVLDGAFVAYGLGNLVFYSDGGPGTDSGVLTVAVTGRHVDGATFHPARIVGQLPRLLEGRAAEDAAGRFAALRACTGLDEAPPATAEP